MSSNDLMAQAHQAMLNLRFADAIRISDMMLQRNPSNVEIIYLKAQALGNLQRDQEALILFDQALSLLDPDSSYAAEVLVSKGDTLLWMEKVDEAEQCFDRALRISPRIARIWVEKARVAAHRKDFPKSIEYCDRALSMNPSDARAWNNKAFGLLQLGKLDECISCADKAIAIDPNYFQAQTWRAQAYEKKEDRQSADKGYEKAGETFGKPRINVTKGHIPEPPEPNKKWWKFWR
jgi:tetratricopeptide (TPR) repeat protein